MVISYWSKLLKQALKKTRELIFPEPEVAFLNIGWMFNRLSITHGRVQNPHWTSQTFQTVLLKKSLASLSWWSLKTLQSHVKARNSLAAGHLICLWRKVLLGNKVLTKSEISATLKGRSSICFGKGNTTLRATLHRKSLKGTSMPWSSLRVWVYPGCHRLGLFLSQSNGVAERSRISPKRKRKARLAHVGDMSRWISERLNEGDITYNKKELKLKY